ncbi:unnamed protein product [Ectocarpus fasciculatus]
MQFMAVPSAAAKACPPNTSRVSPQVCGFLFSRDHPYFLASEGTLNTTLPTHGQPQNKQTCSQLKRADYVSRGQSFMFVLVSLKTHPRRKPYASQKLHSAPPKQGMDSTGHNTVPRYNVSA